MSDIATDTRAIAKRIMPWRYPATYTSSEVPDWEYLRVHALRLADAFDEVREERNAANRENKIMREALEWYGNEFIDIGETAREAIDKVKGTKPE